MADKRSIAAAPSRPFKLNGTEKQWNAISFGEQNEDLTNAAVTFAAAKAQYPMVNNIEYSEKYHRFSITWNAVDGAQQYGIAVKLAGKWKVQAYTAAKTLSFTSPKLKPGSTYEMVVCAKVNGSWDISGITKRSFKVTIK